MSHLRNLLLHCTLVAAVMTYDENVSECVNLGRRACVEILDEILSRAVSHSELVLLEAGFAILMLWIACFTLVATVFAVDFLVRLVSTSWKMQAPEDAYRWILNIDSFFHLTASGEIEMNALTFLLFPVKLRTTSNGICGRSRGRN